uniref:Uncharacterized protein n=1 Tax=Neobodo designis TaxID=312471 RepID=A0A7S1PPE3_NEODS|mmetsp:Transcript_146/g.556  ORF Transcript_146/g.556 Transcript_146/m.556 type:complete len:244 (+) Transcript_146:65-796(+)|eukprot:CAMPEP_0174828442 /NCGR_PEP_ID=MMETSP1114-20130205/1335_1 /TAXON_ID=312471 /ORGANISM="Neobodo designis, Strain CCAP 1951/1" /LENGTH=243 /DNA_ID=CAMNT_0016062159 /DNA_START=61 /DNA_END=792 /DNA_ORIENTATION=+
MSDFFVAAAKCDPSAAKAAPMHIDERVVREEQYKHERLVEQVLKTRLLLEQVDETFKQADDSRNGADADVSYSVAPGYTPPGVVDRDRDPSLRAVGASVLRKRVEDRLANQSKQLQERLAELRRAEAAEREQAATTASERRRQAQRELDASAAAERHAQQQHREDTMRREAEEKARRERKHPIDVFQSRVAMDIIGEVERTDGASQQRVIAAHQTLDDMLDKEKAAKLRYAFHAPCTHVPNGF